MAQGPSHVLCLLKENAVEDLKNLLGPTSVVKARKIAPYSLRAVYGIKGGDRYSNGIHGSDTLLSARKEIHYFFPQSKLVFNSNKVCATENSRVD
jgi:nucleoside-diphosphate kinase